MSVNHETLAEGIERVMAERNKLRNQVHFAESALLLIRATTTDETTRTHAESALETLKEMAP